MTITLERPVAPAGTTDSVMERLFPTPHPYANDPVGYSRDVLKFEPWSKQREVLESVRDNRRTAVRSGHGVGKTTVAARAALWWLRTRKPAKVITTSATWKQVVTQLWAEMGSAYDASGHDAGGKLTEARLFIDNDNFALGLSVDKPENFAGYHSPNLLVILDEASGVNEQVWETAETYLTSPGAHLLAIGNPTKSSGAFFRAFTKERELYNLIQISALDSPAITGEPFPADQVSKLVDQEWVDGRRAAWGEQSPAFQVRVLGKFSTTADDTVCSLADVEAAQERSIPAELLTAGPVVIGCDVARFGSDETVITVRNGNQVRIAKHYVGKNTMETVGHVLAVARAATAETGFPKSFTRIVVDDSGVGGGVTDRLREVLGQETAATYQVVPFNGGNSPITSDYPNRRSELWFSFAERLPYLDIDADDQLTGDLVAPRYALDSQGRRVVEKKEITKKTLLRSPDRADAIMLPFAVPDMVAKPSVSTGGMITSGLMGRPL